MIWVKFGALGAPTSKILIGLEIIRLKQLLFNGRRWFNMRIY
jgi:hypothetical protein